MSWIYIGVAAAGAGAGVLGNQDEGVDVKPLPRTAESKKGGSFLKRLMARDVDIPLQGTADLTATQQRIQDSLGGTLGRIEGGAQAGYNELLGTLQGDFDPRTSPYYEGLRQESERLNREGTTSIRRRAEAGGNLRSAGAIGQEGSFTAQSNSKLLQVLGALYENERNRKTNAAQGIGNISGQEVSNIAAVGGIAETERSIEQQKQNALYSQALQTALFPYQYQSGIAQSLLNFQDNYVVSGGGISDSSAAGAGALGGLGGALGGGGLGGGGGGGGSGGGGGYTFSNQQAAGY